MNLGLGERSISFVKNYLDFVVNESIVETQICEETRRKQRILKGLYGI